MKRIWGRTHPDPPNPLIFAFSPFSQKVLGIFWWDQNYWIRGTKLFHTYQTWNFDPAPSPSTWPYFFREMDQLQGKYTHYPVEPLNLQKWLTWEPSIEHGQHIPELPQDPSERHFRGLILKKSRSRGAVARGLRSPSRSQPEGDYVAALRAFWTHFFTFFPCF